MQTETKGDYAAGVNSELFKALGHPIRYRILMVAGEREVSPTELAELLDEPFSKIYPQVRALVDADLLELVNTDTRLGGEQHFYKVTGRPVIDAETWNRLPLLARETTTAINLGKIIGEVSASVAAGRFDSHPARTILRRPIRVDREGSRKIEAAVMALDEACVKAEKESAERANGDCVDMVSTTLLFPRADG